jgi:hypothetical protein
MYEAKLYPDPNPLVQLTVLDQTGNNDDLALMPEKSGIRPARQRRLSDSYFRLVGSDWVPRVIDDPNFPALILRAGLRVPGWGLRETCDLPVVRVWRPRLGGGQFDASGLD